MKRILMCFLLVLVAFVATLSAKDAIRVVTRDGLPSKQFRAKNVKHILLGKDGIHIVKNNAANDADYSYADIEAIEFFNAMPQLQGDVNDNGTIDVVDVNIVVNIILGKCSHEEFPAADVNGDNEVNITDMNFIINLILNQE